MFKQLLAALSRFNHNIWMASLDSGWVTACIGAVYSLLAIVTLILILTWPVPALTVIIAAAVARLVYAGLTAR
jgi:hypothetical protein